MSTCRRLPGFCQKAKTLAAARAEIDLVDRWSTMSPGERERPEQEAWLALVRGMGGVAGVVTSVAEAEALLVDAKGWL